MNASTNGSGPEDDANEDDGRTPWERFEDLTRRLVAVPKRELDKARGRAPD